MCPGLKVFEENSHFTKYQYQLFKIQILSGLSLLSEPARLTIFAFLKTISLFSSSSLNRDLRVLHKYEEWIWKPSWRPIKSIRTWGPIHSNIAIFYRGSYKLLGRILVQTNNWEKSFLKARHITGMALGLKIWRVGIGLTDLSKSGEGAHSRPDPPKM